LSALFPDGNRLSFVVLSCQLKGNAMNPMPLCPECQSTYVYEDQGRFVCPECGHEWSGTPSEASAEPEGISFLDAHGTPLVDGDTVTLIKDLKVKGASSSLKVGTKVRNIRLVEGDHNIDCKIEGFGAMKLKSEFVKKA
jgi:protein PhnA